MVISRTSIMCSDVIIDTLVLLLPETSSLLTRPYVRPNGVARWSRSVSLLSVGVDDGRPVVLTRWSRDGTSVGRRVSFLTGAPGEGCFDGEKVDMINSGGREGDSCFVFSNVGYSVGSMTLEGIVEAVGLDDVEGTFVEVGNAVSSYFAGKVDAFFGISLGDCGTDDGTMEGTVESRHDLAAF